MSNLDNRVARLLAKPSLEGLAYALRHPEVWPEGFEWGYGECETCAVGLASKLWSMGFAKWYAAWLDGEVDTHVTNASAWVSEHLHLPDPIARAIFMRLNHQHHGYHNVTPHHVATAIDAYLAQRG